MKPYSDTNFFTRSYLGLPGSEIVEFHFDLAKSTGPMPVSWLHRLEFANSLELLVFETRKGGQYRISPESAAAAHALFEEHLQKGKIIHEVILPYLTVTERCHQIILRHTAKHGFRTYDCLHVAAALTLKCDTFWSLDKGALQLAKLEGLLTN